MTEVHRVWAELVAEGEIRVQPNHLSDWASDPVGCAVRDPSVSLDALIRLAEATALTHSTR